MPQRLDAGAEYTPPDLVERTSARPGHRAPRRAPSAEFHRRRPHPQVDPETLLTRRCRRCGWDIVVVVNYSTNPDATPHFPDPRPGTTDSRPRSFADLSNLRGRARATTGYRRATSGVWLPDHIPDDFQARCAALSFARPEVVITGWTAARFHGHLWADDFDTVEVAVGRRRLRRPDVRAHQYEIPEAEIEQVLGPGGQPIRIASPGWTLFDLARTLGRLPAMIALDGSKYFRCDGPRAVATLAHRYPERRGSAAALRVAAEADLKSESPKETELRLFLVDSGFDTFESQVKVPHLRSRIDFADRKRKIAVEYDGRGHLSAAQHARDLERWRALVDDGWIVLPVGVIDLHHRRDQLRSQIRNALISRGWQPQV